MGGGAQGMAIAYKLAKLKYGKDIVVIDQVYQNFSYHLYIFITIFTAYLFYYDPPIMFSYFFNRVKLGEALPGTLLASLGNLAVVP